MKILLRIIAGALALGVLSQSRTLVADLGDIPSLRAWAGPFAAWFVFAEVVQVAGGIVGSIQLWRLTAMGRIVAMIVSVMDGLHSIVPWLLGPALGVRRIHIDGSDLFGVAMNIAVFIVLLQSATYLNARNRVGDLALAMIREAGKIDSAALADKLQMSETKLREMIGDLQRHGTIPIKADIA